MMTITQFNNGKSSNNKKTTSNRENKNVMSSLGNVLPKATVFLLVVTRSVKDLRPFMGISMTERHANFFIMT